MDLALGTGEHLRESTLRVRGEMADTSGVNMLISRPTL
jgi:hypothetical protein